jgi:hypothetical protein
VESHSLATALQRRICLPHDRTRGYLGTKPSKNGRRNDIPDRRRQEEPMTRTRPFDLILFAAAFLFVSGLCVGLI